MLLSVCHRQPKAPEREKKRLNTLKPWQEAMVKKIGRERTQPSLILVHHQKIQPKKQAFNLSFQALDIATIR
jgi:hypothetical protein